MKNIDYCGLSDEFLSALKNWCTYDPDIPFQYRVISKLLSENNYDMAKRILEANKGAFNDKYNYMILDTAIEMSINIVADESGQELTVDDYIKGKQNLKPTATTLKFIEYLLENGADPHLPEGFDQIEHIIDVERDGGQQCGCTFDCSELKSLIQKYM
ncbi:MAG: hypothetical protein J1F11_04110 [Oscillospiraceae bacterium]|nr:hypothetical protein [Oscillospiraceae bacterium]